MTKNTAEKMHKLHDWITLVLISVVALGLIANCVSIYRSGDLPFTRESVSAALAKLAVPGWICVIWIVFGALLQAISPAPDKKITPTRDDFADLCRYEAVSDQLQAVSAREKEHRIRRKIRMISGVFLTISAVYPVLYLTNSANFGTENATADVIKAVIVVLIPTALSFAMLYIARLETALSIRREIQLYKDEAIKPQRVKHTSKTSKISLTGLRIALIALAAVLIVLGIANDGVADVLGKAIRICTECIGLG